MKSLREVLTPPLVSRRLWLLFDLTAHLTEEKTTRVGGIREMIDYSSFILRHTHSCAASSVRAYPPTAPSTHGMGHSCQGRSQSKGITHAPTHAPTTAPVKHASPHRASGAQFAGCWCSWKGTREVFKLSLDPIRLEGSNRARECTERAPRWWWGCSAHTAASTRWRPVQARTRWVGSPAQTSATPTSASA